MDSNIDPESEALIRKLHRELNGLTRSTRGADRVKPSSSQRPGPTKEPPPQRTSSEPLPTNPTKRKAGHGRMDTSGSEASSSGSEKEGRPAKKQKDKKPDVGPEPRSHKAKPHSPLATNSLDRKDPPPADVHKREKVHGQAHEQVKAEHGAPGDPGHHAHAASAQPDPEAPTSSHPGAVATYKTPLEAAAAAASALVKDKVKAGSRGRASEGKRLIKCFHAGVRWGIALAPEALKTRADLATALNDAFAGEILSCGRGDILNIVFLDGEGRVTEFPSIRNSGSRDRSSKWKVSVERAVKIYVRRG